MLKTMTDLFIRQHKRILYCKADGFVHIYYKRPSWRLLPLYSETDSLQEEAEVAVLPSPHRDTVM